MRRNRTCQKLSTTHGQGPHRLVGFGVADGKAREQHILMLEEDSEEPSTSIQSGPDDFPGEGEPALFGRDNPRKLSPGASSAVGLPGPKLKAEISVGRSSLCCA